MRAPIRSGIIGTGFMGTVHTQAIRAVGGAVVAYAGRNPGRTEEAAERAGVELVLSPGELIEHPDVDLVHICTPNAQHVELARAAIAAGKHVVCEKPLAVTESEARALHDAAEEAGVVHAVPFVYRYYPSVRETRARLSASGERIWLAHGHYLQDWLAGRHTFNWRIDDGASRAFADIGVHWCDLLEFMTGHRILRLSANSSQLHETRVLNGAEVRVASEDGVSMLFETDRGATGGVVISQATPGRKNRLWLSLDGERHSYSFDQENPDRLWVGAVDDVSVTPKGTETTRASASVAPYISVPSGHPQGYQDCFATFMAEVHSAIRGNPVEGMPTFEDGVRAARLTEAVVASAEIGNWIELVGAGVTGGIS